jgi:Ca2+-binding RTX toxin-like protein
VKRTILLLATTALVLTLSAGAALADVRFGTHGDDLIVAGEFFRRPGEDAVEGGRGNDEIDARDGFGDLIDCGEGDDTVFFDVRLDAVEDCEELNPPPA